MTSTDCDPELNCPSSINPSSVVWICLLVICSFGLVGNGMVIWLLDFPLQRNAFLTYFLNLVVADLGILVAGILGGLGTVIVNAPSLRLSFSQLFLLMHIASHLLLTAIGIERCASAFFPAWHRGRRPAYLSPTLCVLIWVLSCLLSGFYFAQLFTGTRKLVLTPYFVTELVCLSLMTISGLSLLAQVGFKTQQTQSRKLHTTILMTLFFSILFALLFYVIYTIHFLTHLPDYVVLCGLLGVSLNSSMKPMIYLMVGRQSCGRESMKVLLQRVFKEEEDYGEGIEVPIPNQV